MAKVGKHGHQQLKVSKPQPLAVLNPDQNLGLQEALQPINPQIDDMVPQSVIDYEKLPAHKKSQHQLYNQANVKVVLRAVALGLPQASAAAFIGVTPETISHWKARYKDFGAAVDRANAVNQALLMGRVYEGMTKHPRLALELLERRHSDDFAQTKRVENSGTVNHEHSAQGMLSRLQKARENVDTQDLKSMTEPIEIEAKEAE